MQLRRAIFHKANPRVNKARIKRLRYRILHHKLPHTDQEGDIYTTRCSVQHRTTQFSSRCKIGRHQYGAMVRAPKRLQQLALNGHTIAKIISYHQRRLSYLPLHTVT